MVFEWLLQHIKAKIQQKLQQNKKTSHFLPQENVFLTRQGRASTVINIFEGGRKGD